jgi:tRNA A58 N-methylase Trm61
MKYPTNGKYKWLSILKNIVSIVNPNKIVELGSGSGDTTITMALSCIENNIEVSINSYDLWNNSYWGDYQKTLDNYKKWNVSEYINLYNRDFYDWVETGEEFDLLYFDIDNDSSKLLTLYNKVKSQIESGSVVLFEGGSTIRPGFEEAKSIIDYTVLTGDIKYSVSIIYDKKKYNLRFE